jgi:hypothetical protein
MLDSMLNLTAVSVGAVDGQLYETSLDTLVVRPIVPGEEDQWDALMAAHHYLGFEKTLRHQPASDLESPSSHTC